MYILECMVRDFWSKKLTDILGINVEFKTLLIIISVFPTVPFSFIVNYLITRSRL